MSRRSLAVWKTCGCGLSYSKKEWDALPYCGDHVSEDEHAVFRLELRHCACGSTIGIEHQTRKKHVVTSPLPR